MDRLYRQIAQFGKFRLRNDDSLSDRLNYLHTCVILVLLSVIISTKQYVGEPIQCWTPAHFKGGHDKYANDICWVANTYYLPMDEALSDDIPTRKKTEISYYQYVPFLLLMQAILYYIPCLIWRSFNGHSGINVKSIVQHASDVQNLNPDHRFKTIKFLTRHLELCLENQREYRSGLWVRCRHLCARLCCLFCGKRYGNWLTFLMFICKIGNIANGIGELFIMNSFLGTSYTFYGVQLLYNLVFTTASSNSRHFPRVTMCDFQIRRLGSVHRYTVQCVLPINMFNEKMFIFLWFWVVIVLLATVLDVLWWTMNALFLRARINYVKKFLKILGVYGKGEKKILERFVTDYLRKDGIVVLRLIALNSNDLIVADMMQLLWANYKNRPGVKNTLSSLEKESKISEPSAPSFNIKPHVI